MRDATGIEINVTLSGLNCTDAACKLGYDFASCRPAAGEKAACKYGLHNDFQVRRQQQTWSSSELAERHLNAQWKIVPSRTAQ